ncbi:hypothetical protein O9K51_03638 [Purpureocillium lavendulum]|uniref:Major facilitator superfamily (MFS) profile domain-containing protein n=1 Tax=Purpureocillium lavendulum TaxID=1247861 RepID=A0AB34G3E0_9HYPO|nr:hypothetical protein O9K51_03638 [Purpureocillium lavendulum]
MSAPAKEGAAVQNGHQITTTSELSSKQRVNQQQQLSSEILQVERRDYLDLVPENCERKHSMDGFDEAYTDIVDYIVRCTHRIWDERDIGLIYTHYTHNCVLYGTISTIYDRESIVRDTIQRLVSFPERRGMATHVLWNGDDKNGFYTSHLVTGSGRHTQYGHFGPPTGRTFVSRTIADCMIYKNRIYREWVVADNMAIVKQLGLDPHALAHDAAKALFDKGMEAIDIGENRRIIGQSHPGEEGDEIDTSIANNDIEALTLRWLHDMWNRRMFGQVEKRYADNALYHGPNMTELYGRAAVLHQHLGLLGSIPDAAYMPQHICSNPCEEGGVKVAVRWVIEGHHLGYGLLSEMGKPTGLRVQVVGISHYHYKNGRVVDEWNVYDELSLLTQITTFEAMPSSPDRISGEMAAMETGPSKASESRSHGTKQVDVVEKDATLPLEELTLFERKAALINIEIDKIGMGRYQWYIWLLCGFGYFLDLTWAQGVGLMATAVYQEMGVPTERQGLLSTCANAGLAIGAFFIGVITDIIGRKWAFNITCLVTSVFGMLLAASGQNYEAVCGIYFLACIGLGGNIPIDATIAIEFLPSTHRNLVSLMSMWQPVGVVVASAIAYGTAAKYRCDTTLPSCKNVHAGEACCAASTNMGWRYLMIVIGAMTLTVFFARYLIFRFYESPKFLLSKGREQAAIDVLCKIAKFNNVAAPTLTVEDFQRVEREARGVSDASPPQNAKGVILGAIQELGFLRELFSKKTESITFVLLALGYMGDYWSFNLAGYFLPIVLLQNNVDSGATTVTETYRQYIYIYLPGILGAVLALFSVQLPLIGRKWSLVISAALQGLSMSLYTQVHSTAGYVGLNALEYIMQSRICVEKRTARDAAIPEQWRLKSGQVDDSRLNVMHVPYECGIMTRRELAITEEDVTTLVQKVLERQYSSYEVRHY